MQGFSAEIFYCKVVRKSRKKQKALQAKNLQGLLFNLWSSFMTVNDSFDSSLYNFNCLY